MNCPWGWVNEEDGDELHHGVDAPQQQEHRGHPVQHLLINQSIKDGVDNKNNLRAPVSFNVRYIKINNNITCWSSNLRVSEVAAGVEREVVGVEVGGLDLVEQEGPRPEAANDHAVHCYQDR